MTSSNWGFSALLALCVGNSPIKGQWRGALIFSLICAWMNDWVNDREAGDLERHRGHYDVTVMHPGCCIVTGYVEVFGSTTFNDPSIENSLCDVYTFRWAFLQICFANLNATLPIFGCLVTPESWARFACYIFQHISLSQSHLLWRSPCTRNTSDIHEYYYKISINSFCKQGK